MSKGYALNSEIVQELGKLHITGDIVPPELFQAIQFPAKENSQRSTKPDLLAILILSNLLYWFRPIRPRDAVTDKALGWRQRFAGEWLERSYPSWAEKYGATERQCRDACNRLQKTGWIKIKILPCSDGGSKTLFQPCLEKIISVIFEKSRLTFERESAQADSRLNVSRNTLKRESSIIHEINTLDYSSSNSENGDYAAAAAAAEPTEQHASKHSFGTVLAWTRNKRPDAKNPKGLARTIWRDGSDDAEIQAWLDSQNAVEIRRIEAEQKKRANAEEQKRREEFEIACAEFLDNLTSEDYDSLFAKASTVFQKEVFTKAGTSIQFDPNLFRSSIEKIMFRDFRAAYELAA